MEYVTAGCVDRLAFHNTVVKNQDGTYDVMISALNIHTELSQRVRCIDANRIWKSVYIGKGKISLDDIRITFVGAQ